MDTDLLTKWPEVADLLGYASEDTARKRWKESLKTDDPMPIVIDGRRLRGSKARVLAWSRRRFDRLFAEQLAEATA